MHRIWFAACLAVTPLAGCAQTVEGIDWHLRAINGQVVDPSVTTILRIEADGSVGGKAPCNRYGTTNAAVLPAVNLGPIAATRMACDRLAEEQNFFDSLASIDKLVTDGDQTLILTGPDAKSLEFVRDPTVDPAACVTCPPGE